MQKDCKRCGSLLINDEGICETCGAVYGRATMFQMPQLTNELMLQQAQSAAEDYTDPHQQVMPEPSAPSVPPTNAPAASAPSEGFNRTIAESEEANPYAATAAFDLPENIDELLAAGDAAAQARKAEEAAATEVPASNLGQELARSAHDTFEDEPRVTQPTTSPVTIPNTEPTTIPDAAPAAAKLPVGMIVAVLGLALLVGLLLGLVLF